MEKEKPGEGIALFCKKPNDVVTLLAVTFFAPFLGCARPETTGTRAALKPSARTASTAVISPFAGSPKAQAAAPNLRIEPTTSVAAAAAAPPDLATRKGGSDWPGFLGPAGNSISPERGILSPWPKEGLRL